MVVGAKVCELTDGLLWFVCGLYVVILTSPLSFVHKGYFCWSALIELDNKKGECFEGLNINSKTHI